MSGIRASERSVAQLMSARERPSRDSTTKKLKIKNPRKIRRHRRTKQAKRHDQRCYRIYKNPRPRPSESPNPVKMSAAIHIFRIKM